MLLYVRLDLNFWVYLSLGLCFQLIFAQPINALEAEIVQRSPFCLKPEPDSQKECIAQFFLNPGEKIDVISLSLDRKWLNILYQSNPQSGWIKAGNVKLKLAQSLNPQIVYTFSQTSKHTPLFLRDSSGSLYIKQGAQVYQLEDNQVKPYKTLAFLTESQYLSPGYLTPTSLMVYKYENLEEKIFIQEQIEVFSEKQPQFRTLIRLNSDWPLAHIAQRNGLLFVLGRGQGYWGNNLLTGLNSAGLPEIKFREADELFRFLPAEIRQFLIPDTLFFSALDPDGYLYITAQQRSGQDFVLFKVAPGLKTEWQYLGFIPWPKGLAPHKPKKREPLIPIQIRSSKNATYLIAQSPNQAATLHYYSLTGEHRFQETLTQFHDFAVDAKQTLWTLQGQKLIRWETIY